MARTVGQVLEVARSLLQDELEPYRYSNASIILHLNEAMGEARRVRADLFLPRLDTTPFYSESDMSTPLPLPDFLFSHIVNFVVGRTELRDDTFATDGRAMTLIAAFGVALTGGGSR